MSFGVFHFVLEQVQFVQEQNLRKHNYKRSQAIFLGKKNCLDLEYSVTSLVTSLKVHGLCGYDYGESPV